MANEYNGGLTREQFLFYEIRIVAKLILQGYSRDEILEKVQEENLFQFPTERMVKNMVGTCFKRIDALDSEELVYQLANAPAETAKQVNLYAMMKYNRKVEQLFNSYMQVWLNNDAVKGILDIDFNVQIEENDKAHVAEGYSTGYCDLIDFCMRLALVDTLFENEQPFLIKQQV